MLIAAAQSDLDAAGGLSRHRRAQGRAHAAGARDVHGHAAAFPGALPDPGRGADGGFARRGDLGHGLAIDGGPRRGRGVPQGPMPFMRTAKGGAASRWATAFPALWEGVLGALLVLGSVTCMSPTSRRCTRSRSSVRCCWCKACRSSRRLALALIERSPLNAFATWRRLAELSAYPAAAARARAPTAGPRARGGIGILP